MKTCSKCKQNLPETSFHKNRGTRDGLQTQCKTCLDWRTERDRGEGDAIKAVLPTIETLAKEDFYWLNRLHTLQAKAARGKGNSAA